MSESRIVRRPRISAVVCTRNSKDRIEETLLGLLNQTISQSHYEVLVVDNASDDGTLTWLQEREPGFGFRLLTEAKVGLSAARNRGAAAARGDLIYFTDDDAVAPAHVFETLLEDFDGADRPDLVGGPVYAIWESQPPPWILSSQWGRLSLLNHGSERRLLEYPEILLGCNIAFRKESLDELGPFDSSLGRAGGSLSGCEERHLQWKLSIAENGRILYNPRAYVFHKVSKDRMALSYQVDRIREGTISSIVMAKLMDESVGDDLLGTSGAEASRARRLLASLPQPLRSLGSRVALLGRLIALCWHCYRVESAVAGAVAEGRRAYGSSKSRRSKRRRREC